MPPPLLLRQHIDLRLELRMRRDTLRLRQHHPPLHLFLLRPPQQHSHVIPRLPLIEHLAKHLHPPHHRRPVRPPPHNLHLIPHAHHASPHPPPHHPPPPPSSH